MNLVDLKFLGIFGQWYFRLTSRWWRHTGRGWRLNDAEGSASGHGPGVRAPFREGIDYEPGALSEATCTWLPVEIDPWLPDRAPSCVWAVWPLQLGGTALGFELWWTRTLVKHLLRWRLVDHWKPQELPSRDVRQSNATWWVIIIVSYNYKSEIKSCASN